MNGSTRRHSTDTGNIPVHDGKSFRMRRYEKCASKSRRIRTYEIIGLKVLWIPYLRKKGVGRRPAPQSCRPCWSTPAMTRIVVLGAGFGGPLATFELDRIYRGWPVAALSTRTAVRKGDPRCHPSGK